MESMLYLNITYIDDRAASQSGAYTPNQQPPPLQCTANDSYSHSFITGTADRDRPC